MIGYAQQNKINKLWKEIDELSLMERTFKSNHHSTIANNISGQIDQKRAAILDIKENGDDYR